MDNPDFTTLLSLSALLGSVIGSVITNAIQHFFGIRAEKTRYTREMKREAYTKVIEQLASISDGSADYFFEESAKNGGVISSATTLSYVAKIQKILAPATLVGNTKVTESLEKIVPLIKELSKVLNEGLDEARDIRLNNDSPGGKKMVSIQHKLEVLQKEIILEIKKDLGLE